MRLSSERAMRSCELLRLLTLGVMYCNLVYGSQDAKRLYDDLLTNYNRLIRPVFNNSDRLTVKLGLKLSQLIDVNLKNQIMTTNVWVEQEWHDYKLAWNPEEYGGVQTLYVPSEHIWLPDIVLYNNADGNYEVTIMTKAKLYHTGKVRWKPPAIYKSSCEIDVEYFPFDEQTCFMKFGSWTYDGYMVDLRHLKQQPGSDVIDIGIDLRDYYLSVEWDIMKVPAERFEKFYSCCEEPYPDIKFNITLRRKTLFYTVNLIIPCVGITFLSVLVFYLPSDSGEKVSLSISILLSLTVFFLLLAEIIPPTSLTVPLLGKYLLFTMVLVTFSVMATVAVLNVNFRSPSTHRMAPWVKSIFVEFLPRILFIQRPQVDDDDNDIIGVNGFCGAGSLMDYSQKPLSPTFDFSAVPSPEGFDPGTFDPPFSVPIEDDVLQQEILDDAIVSFPEPHQSPELERAIIGVQFIAQHMKNEDKFSSIAEDWKYVAMVLDRLFLWLFTLACVLGTAGIILSAPTLWDKRNPIDIKLSKIAQRKLNLIPSGEL